MLTSYPNLDSTFSSPVAACPSLSPTTLGDNSNNSTTLRQQLCHPQLPSQRPEGLWLGGCPDFAATTLFPKDFLPLTEDCLSSDPSSLHKELILKKKPVVMEMIEPEDDLKCLVNNELKLRLSGYYYGNLSWVDASHLLKQCKVGTFLVRDSEHGSYLYALSVQTRRGPTSCRIEYYNGRFRLDSSQELSGKMPRFDSVTDLIDHYVHLTKNLPHKSTTKDLSPVWLDMDQENSTDVPVQIYKPLYKGVRSLQHICRVNLVRLQKERHPSLPFTRTVEEHEYKVLPKVLKDYLKEYPYSQ